MEVAIVTVGDELLAGDTTNTNASWLATQLTDRGATVERILTIPDDRTVIAERVAAYATAFNAVIVTGGIGGTPDDVTMDAVADAFDRELTVREQPLTAVRERLAEIEARLPEVDLDVDPEAEAALPAGSRPLPNEEGLAPGCVLENVYVFAGIPSELKAMFGQVAEEFTGNRVTRTLYSVEPEANLVPYLEEVMATFDVTVGCYPDREAGHNRLKIVGTDDDQLANAAQWLIDQGTASRSPVSRNRED